MSDQGNHQDSYSESCSLHHGRSLDEKAHNIGLLTWLKGYQGQYQYKVMCDLWDVQAKNAQAEWKGKL